MQPTEPASSAKPAFGPATAVLQLAVSGRWRAPETTVALADQAAAQARVESDPATALLAEGWLIHGLSVLGRGVTGVSRALAAMSEATRSGNRLAEARLRVGLASVARQLGDTGSARALLAPVAGHDIADLELAADAHIEAVRCGGDAGADGMLAAVDLATDCIRRLRGEQVELGLATIDTTLAHRHRVSGRARAAVARARDGLRRVLGEHAGGGELDPVSPHIAAWLSLELTLALLDDEQPDLARRAAEPALAWAGRPAALVPLTRLRLVLAKRVHLPAGEHDAALRAVSWAAGMLAEQDLPELEAERQSLLAEVHERRGALAEALAASRKAQEGLRLQAARVEQTLVLLSRASGASGTSQPAATPFTDTALSFSPTPQLSAVWLPPVARAPAAGLAASPPGESRPGRAGSASAAEAGAEGAPIASDSDDRRAARKDWPRRPGLPTPSGQRPQPVDRPDDGPAAPGRTDSRPASVDPDAPSQATGSESTRALSSVGSVDSTNPVEGPSATHEPDPIAELDVHARAGPDDRRPPSVHGAGIAAPRDPAPAGDPYGLDQLPGPADTVPADTVPADPFDARGLAAGGAGLRDAETTAAEDGGLEADPGYRDTRALDEAAAPDELSGLDDISELIDPNEDRPLGLVAIDVVTPNGSLVGAFARPLLDRVVEYVRVQLPPNARLRVLASDVVLVVLPPVESAVVVRWMRSVAGGLSARWAEYAADVPRSAFRFAVGALDVARSPAENVRELCARLNGVPPQPSAGITPVSSGGRHVARSRPAIGALNGSDRTAVERGTGGRRRRPESGVDGGPGGAEAPSARAHDDRPGSATSSGTNSGLDHGSSPNGRRRGIDRTALARLAELAWSPPSATASRGVSDPEQDPTGGPTEAVHGVDLLTHASEVEVSVFEAELSAGAQHEGAAEASGGLASRNGTHDAGAGAHEAPTDTAGTGNGLASADGTRPTDAQQQGAQLMSELSFAELLAGALAAYRNS